MQVRRGCEMSFKTFQRCLRYCLAYKDNFEARSIAGFQLQQAAAQCHLQLLGWGGRVPAKAGQLCNLEDCL